MKTSDYCPECWRLYDQLCDAQNRRAFIAQQVRDVGSMHMITLHRDADMIAKLAQAAFDAHKMTCEKRVKA
jgi:hypothetical protein